MQVCFVSSLLRTFGYSNYRIHIAVCGIKDSKCHQYCTLLSPIAAASTTTITRHHIHMFIWSFFPNLFNDIHRYFILFVCFFLFVYLTTNKILFSVMLYLSKTASFIAYTALIVAYMNSDYRS